MTIKLSDYVFQVVAKQGVKHVFFLPGGGAMHLNDSLGHCQGLEFVSCMHEQAAVMAAETYSKVTCNLGVALVTTGPGGTNALTGVVGAWLDSTPLLIISGQVKRSDLIGDSGVRQMGVQEVNIVPIVKSVTKYAVTVMEPDQIRYHLEKAIYLAKRGRPGPVWLDIPLDVQASLVEPSSLAGFIPEIATSIQKEALSTQVKQVASFLQKSKRPILLVGNGVRLAGAQEELAQVMEKLHIPVQPTWLASDLVPEDSPYFVGRPGTIAPRGANFNIQNADLLLSIGSRLDIAITGYDRKTFARAACKIIVDIDPSEINKLTGICDLSIQADAKDFLIELNQQIQESSFPDTSSWLEWAKKTYLRYPVVVPEYRSQEKNVNTYVLSEAFSAILTNEDVLVPGSSGAGIEIFQLAYKVKAGQRLIQTTALGAMGNGLPSAIGACIASGKRRTISVDGDGGFQLNIQELEVVRRLALPIKFFILNNNGYASIRSSQKRYFSRLTGADPSSGFTLPDICKVAEAYGLTTRKIDNQVGLKQKLLEVINLPGPVLCEVMVEPEEPRAPSLSSRVLKSGNMLSKPLEDLWPFLDRQEFLSNMLIPPVEEPEE